ncbi:MAG TPA: NGG1p interacting factor NIF3 [Elusimicrobia bacterium]|jgi:putative NIF3 family GTP cyclohydrolase 1 type 2|nr:NGG1p interacting factor NIF3 [Elusimicrobiota bacterium]
MRLNELYQFIIEEGIGVDPRGKEKVIREQDRLQNKFDKFSPQEKEDFDLEKLHNPYADTRIVYGKGDEEIKTLLVGIDIEGDELLLADILRSRGKKIDLVLSHHPAGHAYASFYEVMSMQADILSQFGVPINIAEGIMEPRIKEVSRKISPRNHMRTVDTARLLNLSLLCVHTPADNHVCTYLQKLFDVRKPERLEEVLEILKEQPEYKNAIKEGCGPLILTGSKERHAGKIFVDMTGGTEGSTEAIEKLATAGVGTIVAMHLSEEHYKNAEKYHLNVIIAGHIPSDNLGLNLILDKVEKKFGKLEIIPCSGFQRYPR